MQSMVGLKELKKMDLPSKNSGIKDILQTNLFVFKENLKLVFSGVVDQIWNTQLEKIGNSSPMMKEPRSRNSTFITEIPEAMEDEEEDCLSNLQQQNEEQNSLEQGETSRIGVRSNISKSLKLDDNEEANVSELCIADAYDTNTLIRSAVVSQKPVLSGINRKLLNIPDKTDRPRVKSVASSFRSIDGNKDNRKKKRKTIGKKQGQLSINSHNNINISINIHKKKMVKRSSLGVGVMKNTKRKADTLKSQFKTQTITQRNRFSSFIFKNRGKKSLDELSYNKRVIRRGSVDAKM